MRKHFLLVFLLALLPLVGWAQSLSSTTAKWDGSSHDFPTVTLNGSTIPVSESSYYENGNYRYRVNHWRKSGSTTNITQYQTVGTYTANVQRAQRTGGYWGSFNNYQTLNFTVTKAEPVVNLLGFSKPYAESGWVEPTVATMPSTSYTFDADGTNLTFAAIQSALTWSRNSTSTDVGSYSYTLTVSGSNDNYEIKVSPGTFEITAVDGIWDVTPVGKAAGSSVKYDGTDKALADLIETEAVYSGGTVEYSTDGLAWSEDLSTVLVGKDYGTYTVQYRGNGDKNHNDIAGSSFTVNIDKYQVTAGTDFNALEAIAPNVYTGSPLALVSEVAWTGPFASELAGAIIKYNGATAIPMETNVGTYPVALEFDFGATPNFEYAGAPISVDGKITKAPITSADYTLPSAVTGLVYDGSNMDLHTELVWTAGAKGTVRYWRNDTGDWNTNVRWRNVAGDWQIRTAIMPDANHEFASTDEYIETVNVGGDTYYIVQDAFDVSIAKRAITIASNGDVDSKVFNGAAQGLVAAAPTFTGVGGVTVPGTVTYAWNDGTEDKTATNVANVVATNVGEYAITYTFTPATTGIGPNYSPITEAQALGGAEAKAEITKATLNFGVNSLTKDWAEGVTYEWANIVKELVTSDDWLAGEDDAAKAAILAAALNITVNGGAADASNEDFVALLAGDAGVYNIALTANDDAEGVNYKIKLYNDATNVTINKIDATLAELEAATPIYNGGPQSLVSITTAAKGGTVKYFVGDAAPAEDATDWSETIPQETNAATYKVWQMVEGDKNHNNVVATAAVEVTIAQKALADAMFALTPDDLEYTGEDLKDDIIITATDGEPNAITADDYEVSDITFNGNTVTEVKDAGEYTLTFTGKGNYTSTAIAKITIGQAVATIATAPVANDLTYTGKAQELVTAGTSNDGTVLYSLTGEATDFAEAIPTATDWAEAGYNVYYMVKGDKNHTNSDVFGPINVMIKKADAVIDPATAAINLTYNGKDQELVEAAVSADGKFEYSLTGEETDFAEAIPTGLNAGEYTVYTKFIPDGNHNDATVKEVKVTIEKATIGYQLGNLTKVWNGVSLNDESEKENLDKLFTIVSGELFEGDKYNVPFTLILPEDFKNVKEGGYTFTQADYEYNDPEGPKNYDVKFTGTGNIVIEKADIEADDYTAPTAPTTPLTFTGKAQELVTAGKVTTTYLWDGDEEAKPIGTIVFSTEEDGEYTTTIPEETDATSYTVYFKVQGDDNHNDTKPQIIENVEIGALAIDENFFELSATEAQYDKTDLKPTVTIVDAPIKAEDFVVTYQDAKGTELTKLINAGKYTVVITPAEGGNLTGDAVTKDFEITKRPAQAVAYNATKVYDGIAGLGETKVEFTFTNLVAGDDDAITMGEAVYFDGEAKNAGEYTMLFDLEKFSSDNYEVLGVEDTGAKFTITKAPLTISWNEKADPFTKEYGAENPKFEATSENVVLEGAIAGEENDIFSNIVFTRVDDSEDVNEDPGYDLAMSAKQIKKGDNWKDADVFDNYEYTFGTAVGAFTITPAKIIVSLKPQTKVYDGVKVTTIEGITAEDLVVTHLKGGNVKDAVFTTLPTATVTDGATNVGEYEIKLAGAVATNYEIEDYFTTTLTIEPAPLTFELAPQQIRTGEEVNEETIDATKFTVEGIVTADAEKKIFAVDVNEDLMNMDAKITATAGTYEDGLVIIALDKDAAANYSGWDEAFGELLIISGETIVLADNEDCKPEAQEGVDVTFASRKINAGTWNVVALPFAVSVPEISDAFGYAAVDILDQTNANPKEIHFKVISSYIDSKDKKIPAYTPFIVKTTEDEGFKKTDFDQVVFHNVNIEAGDGENKSVEDAAGNKFWGTFQAETKIWGEKFRYMSKGAWYDAKNYTESNPAKIGAFRGYIEMVEAGARIFIEEPDGTVTAIDAVEFNKQAAEGMYNLNGVKVNNLNRKGVYIKNGVKVIK